MKSVVVNKEDLRYNIEKIKEYINSNSQNEIIERDKKIQNISEKNSNTFLDEDKSNNLNRETKSLQKIAKIIAVVKGNGYGLGIVKLTNFLIDNGIDFFAVATVEEAIQLRNAGIKAKILMLSSTAIEEDVRTLAQNDIILTIGSVEAAKTIEKVGNDLNKKIKAHLKIDTGFGRYGFIYSNTDEIIDNISKLENVKIEGTFTHFSNAYYDDNYTKLQFERFMNCIKVLKENNVETGMLHACNTSAFIKFPQMCLDAVRIGSGFLRKNFF